MDVDDWKVGWSRSIFTNKKKNVLVSEVPDDVT